MEDLLENAFDQRPVLLVIDDLEQILETPSPGQLRTPVRDTAGSVDAWRIALAAVLQAFNAADTDSRLLLTSRYDFTLPDGRGRDLADQLQRVGLRPMDDDERAKQWRAAQRSSTATAPADEVAVRELVALAQREAGGNPGLQEILCRPILSGELTVARDAVHAVAHWRRSGRVPEEDSAAQEFFARVSFQTYRDALTEQELTLLHAATLFSAGLPVPVAALHAAGGAVGARDPDAGLARLIALGLVDAWDADETGLDAALNPLARPLAAQPLDNSQRTKLASAAITVLADAWQNEDGDFPFDARGVEAARLALDADAPAELLDKTAYAAATFLFWVGHDARSALALVQPALAKIDAQAGSPRPQLLRLAADCAERVGENDLRVSWLERGLSLAGHDPVERARIAVAHATATIARDGPQQALATLQQAAAAFGQAGSVRSRAVTMGKIADVLQQRGETDEALRIRREEELPVYDRLGDVRSRAVTMGKIADVLQQRGETDEALRIRREEQLPVYDRLGDVRERAITMGQIADVLQQRGETDEALRIHLAERLPVAQTSQDMDSVAHVRFSCAQLRISRGGLQEGEGQVIFDELSEAFGLYQQLQRVDGIAVVGAVLGQMLAAAGATSEAATVLEKSAAAFDTIGQPQQAAQIRAIAAGIPPQT